MENSSAVVKGSSNEIGSELAKRFGKEGFELLIVSNTDENFSLFVRRAQTSETKVSSETKNNNEPAGFETFYGW